MCGINGIDSLPDYSYHNFLLNCHRHQYPNFLIGAIGGSLLDGYCVGSLSRPIIYRLRDYLQAATAGLKNRYGWEMDTELRFINYTRSVANSNFFLWQDVVVQRLTVGEFYAHRCHDYITAARLMKSGSDESDVSFAETDLLTELEQAQRGVIFTCLNYGDLSVDWDWAGCWRQKWRVIGRLGQCLCESFDNYKQIMLTLHLFAQQVKVIELLPYDFLARYLQRYLTAHRDLARVLGVEQFWLPANSWLKKRAQGGYYWDNHYDNQGYERCSDFLARVLCHSELG